MGATLSPTAAQTFDASPPPTALTFSIGLYSGWTFISFNLEPSDTGINAVFGRLTSLQGGDHVKNQYVFTDYYDGFGFFGGLTTLTTDDMYAVKVATSTTLTVSGTPVALPKPITLNSGWTWLPCPYQSTIGLADGVPEYTYTNGDQCKSQGKFAEYYEGFGFFGTLTTLAPGEGYKMKVSTGGSAVFTA